MFERTKKNWHIFRAASAGDRFQSLYRAKHPQSRGGFCLTDFLMILLGCLLMVVGLAIGWLPGPGGFVGIIGLAIVAQQFLWVARLLDQTECWFWKCWNWLKSRFWKTPRSEV